MTAGETWVVGGRRGGGWLRRAWLAALALYLAPAVLVVLVIGGVGVLCCGAMRLAGGRDDDGPDRPDGGRGRRHGPARTPGTPHVWAASRSWSSSR